MFLDTIQRNLDGLLLRIGQAAARSGRRPSDITLVAVTKQQPAHVINGFIRVAAERRIPAVIGENYVSEFREKREFLEGDYSAHLIGPLQKSHMGIALRLFSTIQTVGTVEVLESFIRQPASARLPIFLQVNISNDPDKSGFAPQDVLGAFQRACGGGVQPAGLMTVPAISSSEEETRLVFRSMAALRENILRAVNLEVAPFQNARCDLSMGMSDDFEVAIEEGADVVRIGSLLFGSRR
jgi:pyridoxal phosphate enzyme (YggS family)